MIFFGTEYWTTTKPVYPLLDQLAQDHDYHALLSIEDDVDTIADRLLA